MKPVITQDPPVKAKPFVDMEVLASIHPELLEDAYMYVHCHFDNPGDDMLIRIWRTTFLIDRSSSSRAEMVHAENITYAPQWTVIPDGQSFNFLLIFSRLPKSCTLFDLKEEIPQPGGFHIRNIERNDTDVYHVALK